ncbi:uncharacterized protein LOC143020972 isoform X2 [Oratosquilla oratoria]|uniref:uncharacterized protein LOC143020972 isoform X2 n=1 Tax=Oratosquilla oratoria TaxID=337810 RepID=UPI003F771542
MTICVCCMAALKNASKSKQGRDKTRLSRYTTDKRAKTSGRLLVQYVEPVLSYVIEEKLCVCVVLLKTPISWSSSLQRPDLWRRHGTGKVNCLDDEISVVEEKNAAVELGEEDAVSPKMAQRHLVSEVREGPLGKDVTTVNNPLILLLGLIEFLVIVALGGLNYCLRFDSALRSSVSLVNWKGVSIPCVSVCDGTLSHPMYNYEDPKQNVNVATAVAFEMPEWVFFTCFFTVPILLIVVGEAVASQFHLRRLKLVTVGSWQIPLALRRIGRFTCGFLLGGSLVGCLVAVLKLMIPSPRPHLLAACNDPTTNLCTMKNCTKEGIGFLYLEVQCSFKDVFHEALRSFPSYHATLALYGGVFASLYTSRVIRVHGVYSCTGVLVAALMVMAFIGATHRLFTGHAFLVDVLAGGILGTLAAFCMVRCLLNKFKEHRWRFRKYGGNDDSNLLPINPLDGGVKNKRAQPAQAVNQGVSRSPPKVHARGEGTTRSTASSIPPAPPMPSRTGPPPKYPRPEVPAWSTGNERQNYNVPRQRMSAPSGPEPRPKPPQYQPRPLSFYRQDSETLPRTRTETASYF